MNTHHYCFAATLLCAAMACCGCVDSETATLPNAPAETANLISATTVGEYRIGISTLEGILGADTSEARKAFAEKGLNFEFNQGKELTGVTVSSGDYALEVGLRVGNTAEEVRKKLGEPKANKIELKPKQIELDALVYDEYVFLLDPARKVAAIRIGR